MRSAAMVSSLFVPFLLFHGCQSPSSDPAAGDTTAAESEPVSSPGDEAGWESLFDGETLAGWRGYRMEGVPAGWSVSDGLLHFAPPDEGERSDLMTEASYADFELELEWAVTPGGNSGVFFRVSEDGERSYHTGPELQILDNAGHRDGQSPLTSAGSNYALHAPTRDVTKPVGEFNEVRLLVQGDHVEHWMNGEKIVEYTLWDDAWRELVEASKFASMPRYGLNHEGHIVLQDHGDEIWFRNLRIRRLPES